MTLHPLRANERRAGSVCFAQKETKNFHTFTMAFTKKAVVFFSEKW
jgi:hypothetical protein